jgi:transcription antitermination factor NusG
MPILAAEPDRYPAHLLDLPPADGLGGLANGHPGRSWWALHTKPRQEKSLARRLLAEGIAFYLPSVARRCRVRGRVLTSHVPLFTSYLFLLADREERVAALASDRVVHSLPVHDQDRLWHDLRQIDRLIAAGVPVETESRLAPGTPVEITTGPLAGLSGTIVRTVSGRRFVVRVDFIQQGASVLLEDCALLPLRHEGAAVP